MIAEITSRRALRQAFGRVRDNGGCRGADGVTLAAFEANLESELDRLEGSLLRRCYRPFPLLRFSVPKRSGGERFLAVPTVRDRVIQTAVYAATRPVFEAELEDVSHAFRVGRSVRSAIHQIDQLRGEGYGWIVDADIDGFFDAIPLRRLLEKVRRLRLDPYVADLFELWARCEVYDGARVFVPERGIAQGSVVSPMLANLFLDELDENFALFGKKVVRYCDDFPVLCKRREETAEALELTDYLLAELELVLNRDKTRTTSFEQGFRFLGAIFLRDSIFLPFEAKKEKPFTPQLPQPLDLLLYLELRNPLPPLPDGGRAMGEGLG